MQIKQIVMALLAVSVISTTGCSSKTNVKAKCTTCDLPKVVGSIPTKRMSSQPIKQIEVTSEEDDCSDGTCKIK